MFSRVRQLPRYGGPNIFDLPDDKAMELYAKYSSVSNKGNKVYRTDEQDNIRLILKGAAAGH